jgi:hypothetical protein
MELSESYETNLQNLIAAIRDDFNGGSEMPFVIGRSNSFLQTLSNYPYIDMVRDAQVDVANSDPAGAWINGDDLSRYPDDVHYDAAGQLELGRRFANAYLVAAHQRGDFNTDGVIDAADYVIWRNGLSGGTQWQAGYDIWRAHFGESTAVLCSAFTSNHSVPEPATLTLLGICFLSLRRRWPLVREAYRLARIL